MLDRSDNRPPPPDIRYPQSTEIAPGTILAAIIAAFLVIGIVVYSVGQPPQANVQPRPETTGRSEPAPVPPVIRPPANPNAIPPAKPFEEPRLPPVR